jgi:protein LSM14
VPPPRAGGPPGGHRGGGDNRGGGGGGGMPRPAPAATGGDGLLPTRMAVPQEDFDFEGAFMKFRKDELFNKEEMKMAMPTNAAQPYVKDDFFDSMSCEALEKQAYAAQEQQQAGGGGGRGRFAEMRKLDMDTFGAAGGANRSRGRGGGRGPGGGGRGDGQRTDNRGGYQGGEVLALINRSTYQMKPFYLSNETVTPIK